MMGLFSPVRQHDFGLVHSIFDLLTRRILQKVIDNQAVTGLSLSISETEVPFEHYSPSMWSKWQTREVLEWMSIESHRNEKHSLVSKRQTWSASGVPTNLLHVFHAFYDKNGVRYSRLTFYSEWPLQLVSLFLSLSQFHESNEIEELKRNDIQMEERIEWKRSDIPVKREAIQAERMTDRRPRRGTETTRHRRQNTSVSFRFRLWNLLHSSLPFHSHINSICDIGSRESLDLSFIMCG
jgi:hypothetical protein